jgi:nucleotide-binding universal stress UspA family protein
MDGESRSKPIVVGVDGSEHSRRALDWGVDEATRRHCPLRLVHSEARDHVKQERLTEAEQMLAREAAYAASVAPGVEIATEFDDAPPTLGLLVEGAGAEMIVVGNRGRGGFASLGLGSVGVTLASHCPCPLVVVRGPHQETGPGPSVGRVVVGVDGSAMSELALEFAFQEASLHGSGLTAAHTWTLPVGLPSGLLTTMGSNVELLEEDQEQVLERSLAGWRERHPDVSVAAKTLVGHVGHALIEESRGALMVVVGSRGRGGFSGLVLGSTSQALIHHAPCPVAVVRRG